MDQLDRSLRGDVLSVHNPYHFSELDKLWNLTDSALKRIPQGGHSGEDSHQTTEISSADIQNSLRTLVASSKDAIVLLDEEKRVQMLNGLFEEITGIREDASLGQQLTQVSRDQAFAAMIQDLLERTQPGSQGVVEDFDFSGMGYKIYCTSIGASIGGHSKAYILWLIKNDG
jgi:PAS domain S-box-containing protein